MRKNFSVSNPGLLFFILLGCITLINFFLYLYRIDQIPQGVSTDILLYFSNARAIAETGKDIYGNILPLYFSHKSILMMPVTVYVIAFFYSVFGSSHIIGYLPNILMSSLSIFITGMFAYHLSNSRRIGLLAASMLTISPWHFHLSRSAFEGVFGFTLVLIGIYFSMLGLKRTRYLYWSLFMFLLAAFSYKAVNIFLLTMPFIILCKTGWQNFKTKNIFVYSIAIYSIVFIQWVLLFFVYKDTYATGIVSNNITLARQSVATELNQSDAPHLVKSIMSNTPVSLGRIFIKNYLNFFSPQYLFINGDTDNRFSTTGHGQLYYIDAFFIIVGCIWLWRNNKKKDVRFLLAIIIVAPFSSLISDEQYAVRTYIVVFIFSILSAYGINACISYAKRTKNQYRLLIPIVTVYLLFFVFYVYQYHFLYIHYGRESWGGTNREVFEEVYTKAGLYDHITMGNSSEFDFLEYMYWNQLSASEIQRGLSVYNEKELQYANISFVRDCAKSGNSVSRDVVGEKDLLYTYDFCYKEVEPLNRYYLPKTLIYRWKSYDHMTIRQYFNTIQP